MQIQNKKETEITLWIDSYSDIFSDFAPRLFAERTISDHFVTQVKRVSRGNSDGFNKLKLFVPDGTQKEEHGRVIKKRLKTYFRHISELLRDELIKLNTVDCYLSCLVPY